MSLTEAQLLEDIRRRLFSPATSPAPRAVGLELELIPVHRATRGRALVFEESGAGTARILSALGRSLGWSERRDDEDAPSWNLTDGSCISFEPGGQIEFSTAPHPTASAVISAATDLVGKVRDAMSEAGVDLVAAGVDPYNPVQSVPLQRHRRRYTGMTTFFDSIGPSGVQMMRQTAALQLNVERGRDPAGRWSLLNALAPVVVALFANSRRYAGSTTDHRSYRAYLWRTLDPSRTGIVADGADPAAEYHRFAMDALAMRSSRKSGRYQRFSDWMKVSDVAEHEWLFHLSTLFPEVRAKEYFELRSADTIQLEYLAAPVVFVTGIVYDDESAEAAIRVLRESDSSLLERAGRLGLEDPQILQFASALSELALDGAARLGVRYITTEHAREAAEFFRRALQNQDA